MKVRKPKIDEFGVEVRTLEDWLGTLGLSEYTEMFIDNGWDNLMVVHELAEYDLDLMNIKNRVHRAKILHAVSCLQY